MYTLDNVKSLNLYFSNKSGFLDKIQKENIQTLVTTKLEKAGFVFGETDAIILVVSIEAVEVEGTFIVNTKLALGEEVRTKRKDKIETFALTYEAHDFMESDEPYEDTLESLNFLLHEFIAAHKDDNE